MAMAATNWQNAQGDDEVDGVARQICAADGLRLLQRQRVRPLPASGLVDRPARQLVWAAMNNDRLRRNLTQDQYAELLGGSGSSISRFRRVRGKLPKVMSQRLLALHPRWKPKLKALVLEDALHDGTLGATTTDD